MDTNCSLLVADLFLFFYERDFMMSLSDDKQADIINAITVGNFAFLFNCTPKGLTSDSMTVPT